MRILLLYAPLQHTPGAVPKPDGSLGLPYLAGALRAAGHEVAILDTSVGWADDPSAFGHRRPLPSGQVRIGLTNEEILSAAEPFDVFGVSSTFTAQHSMALHLVWLLAAGFPDRPLLVGGVNARFFASKFLAAGATAVFLSEAEQALLLVMERLQRGSRDLRGIAGLALREGNTAVPQALLDLDNLPMPAWDLLPNAHYWSIGRPHGGALGSPLRYAAMMTSRGCPYRCDYCHISVEKGSSSSSGEIGRLRVKSVARVVQEVDVLQALGVEAIYLEDDSLLAKKPRALQIFRAIADRGLRLADVNGVNIAHLFRNAGEGKLEPDVELLDAMAACGFVDLCLPFESGVQRVIDKYASAKWNVGTANTEALIQAVRTAGIRCSGNYMIGYPDETEVEIQQTLALARRHRAVGLDEADVFLVVPFPGTRLFDCALKAGHLAPDWHPDGMRWFNPVMQNTATPPERLEELRNAAWVELNSPSYVAARQEAAL